MHHNPTLEIIQILQTTYECSQIHASSKQYEKGIFKYVQRKNIYKWCPNNTKAHMKNF